MLTVRDIEAGYGHVRILDKVSLVAERGCVTALLGANGAGKTTLMRSLAGLLPLQSGAIALDGVEIGRLSSSQRVDQGITLVPEGRLVFPGLTVAENLRLGAITRRTRRDHAARMAEMYELFPRLAERRNQTAGTLSGGEQQMLAIGRGLMSRPTMLLLDEPTLGLAPVICELIYQTIARLTEQGLTILLAEQNVPRALSLARNAYVLESGRVAVAGAANVLADDPQLRAAFLGTKEGRC